MDGDQSAPPVDDTGAQVTPVEGQQLPVAQPAGRRRRLPRIPRQEGAAAAVGSVLSPTSAPIPATPGSDTMLFGSTVLAPQSPLSVAVPPPPPTITAVQQPRIPQSPAAPPPVFVAPGAAHEAVARILQEPADYMISAEDLIDDAPQAARAAITSSAGPATSTTTKANDMLFVESTFTGGFRGVRYTSSGEEKPARSSTPEPIRDVVEDITRNTARARHFATSLLHVAQGALAGFAVLHLAMIYGGNFTGGVQTYLAGGSLGVQRTFYTLSVLALLGTVDTPSGIMPEFNRRLLSAARVVYFLCFLCNIIASPIDIIYGASGSAAVGSSADLMWHVFSVARTVFATLGWLLVGWMNALQPGLQQPDLNIRS